VNIVLPLAGRFEPRMTHAALGGIGIAFGMFWALQMFIAAGVGTPAPEIVPTPVFLREIVDKPVDPRVRPPLVKPKPPETPPVPRITPRPTEPTVPVVIRIPVIDLMPGPGTELGPPGVPTTGQSELVPVMRVAPQYPRAAARDGIAGYVVFELVINPDGTVRSAKPIEAQPRGVFEAAATQAIQRWKFRPKVVDGKAVESIGTQQIDFKLEAE